MRTLALLGTSVAAALLLSTSALHHPAPAQTRATPPPRMHPAPTRPMPPPRAHPAPMMPPQGGRPVPPAGGRLPVPPPGGAGRLPVPPPAIPPGVRPHPVPPYPGWRTYPFPYRRPYPWVPYPYYGYGGVWPGRPVPYPPLYWGPYPWIYPYYQGYFQGPVGSGQVWQLNGGGPSYFWIQNSLFMVDPEEIDKCANWDWDRNEIQLTPDPDRPGWYIAYNLQRGTSCHVQYVGSI